MADVSVIIVTRNTSALTCAAIRSVQESDGNLSVQTMVVDNASTDNTANAVAEEFPQVRYIRSERNLGFARANNLGAQGSTSEFVLLLNSDARLKNGSLATAVRWMRKHPECGIAGAQLLHPDGSRQNSIANYPSLATELLNKSLLRRLWPNRFPGKEHRFNEPVEVESVIGAFMLVRRDLWLALGGFDEQFFFFFEETDFCLRARRRGAKTFHLPHVEVWHAQGQSARQIQALPRIEYWRSRYVYFRKHHSALARAVLRAGLGFRLFVNWVVTAMATLLTLGRSARWRSKSRVNAALVWWHLRGCPDDVGIPR